jgi:hypothetical protein
MRHLGLSAVATALVLTGVGGWVASTTRARVEPPMHVRVDPVQIMRDSKGLPVQRLVDFSLVFE